MTEEEYKDPDSNDEAKFSWDEDYQRMILSLLLIDRIFLVQSIGLIKPAYFPNKAHDLICSILFDFYNKYKILPKVAFLRQEIKDKTKNNLKSQIYYLTELESLERYFVPGMESREYLLDKITGFAKIQALRIAYGKVSGILSNKGIDNDDAWNQSYDVLRNAMNVSHNFDIGLEYFKNKEERYNRLLQMNEVTERFITGFESIDNGLRAGGLTRGEIGSFIAGSGVGKCHSKNTLVLMYDGTFKAVQNVCVGDLLMGDDSTPRKVIKLHRGMDRMYDVIPVKGEKYTVTSDHILVLKSMSKSVEKNNRCINTRYFNNKFKNEDFFEISIEDYLKQSKRFQKTIKGVRTGVNFNYKKVKINPYILGVWLGDGTTGAVDITTQDFDVLNEMWRYADDLNLDVNEKERKGNASTYSICKKNVKNEFRNNLKYYNVFENKHVPLVYKVNSRSIRLQILAGLLDSDGSLENNCYVFSNKNKTLAEDVVFLARSLGFAAYIKSTRKKCQTGHVGLYWVVTISGNCEEIPVRIKYKKAHKRKQIKDVLVTGIDVKYAGVQEYYGFETDGNHRYLLHDFTIVHNSVALACVASANVRRGRKVLYITLELSEDKVGERFDSILTGEPIILLQDRKEDVFQNLENIVEDFDDKNLLLIKGFPAGTADTNTIRAYISQIKFYGFTPDVVIVDYVGEMKTHAEIKTYESREKIVRELRALGIEEKFAVFTAMQPNRGSKDDKEELPLDDKDLADSFGQIRPLDACWSINVSKTEHELHIGRIHVIKHRDGKTKYTFYVEFDRNNLRIQEISYDTYKNKRSLYKNRKITDVSIDDVVGGVDPTKFKESDELNNDDDDEGMGIGVKK